MMIDETNETKCVLFLLRTRFIKCSRCIPARECVAWGLKIKLGHAGKHLKWLHFAALRCSSHASALFILQNRTYTEHPELRETDCSVNILLVGALLNFTHK